MNILQKCEQVPELEDRARILRVAYLELSGWDKWMPVSAFYELAAVEMVLERGWWVKIADEYGYVVRAFSCGGQGTRIIASAPTLLEALTAALKGGE